MNNIIKTLTLVLPVAALLAATSVSANDKGMDGKITKKYNDCIEDITENYSDAVDSINNSDFTADQKKTLKSQAEANRDLATKNAKAVKEQLTKNVNDRADFRAAIKDSWGKKKTVKAVDEILLDK